MPEKPARGLYDDEPTAPVSVDTTPEVKVEDFDPKAFIQGIRPYREATLIYPGGDLIPRMRELAAKIDATEDGDPALNDLIDEFDAARKAFTDGGRWWGVEGRSTDAILAMRRAAAKQRGIDLDENDLGDLGESSGAMTDTDRLAILLDQLAEQIVVPSGVTRADLQTMLDIAEPEVAKLISAMTLVNTRAAQGANVFALDFSSRRSGNRRQRRSSPRSK